MVSSAIILQNFIVLVSSLKLNVQHTAESVTSERASISKRADCDCQYRTTGSCQETVDAYIYNCCKPPGRFHKTGTPMFADSTSGSLAWGPIAEFMWNGGAHGKETKHLFLTEGPCNCTTRKTCLWMTSHYKPDYDHYEIGTDDIIRSITGQDVPLTQDNQDGIYSYDPRNFYQLWPCDEDYVRPDHTFDADKLGECGGQTHGRCDVAQPTETTFCFRDTMKSTSMQNPDRFSTPLAYNGSWYVEWKDGKTAAAEAGDVSIVSTANPSNPVFEMYIARHAQSFANVVDHACPTSMPMTDVAPSEFTCNTVTKKCTTTIQKPAPVGTKTTITCNMDDDLVTNSNVHFESYPTTVYQLKQSKRDAHITPEGIDDTYAAAMLSTDPNSGWVGSDGNKIIISSPLMRTIETASILYHTLGSTDPNVCPPNIKVSWTKNAQEIFYDPQTNGDGQILAYNMDATGQKADMEAQINMAEDYLNSVKGSTQINAVWDQVQSILTCFKDGLKGPYSSSSPSTYYASFYSFPTQSDWMSPYQTGLTWGSAPLFQYWTGRHWVRSRMDGLIADVQQIVGQTGWKDSGGQVLIVAHSGVISHLSTLSSPKSSSGGYNGEILLVCVNFRSIESPWKVPSKGIGAGGVAFDTNKCPCKLTSSNAGVYKLEYPCAYMAKEMYKGAKESSWSIFEEKCEMRTCAPTSWSTEDNEVTLA